MLDLTRDINSLTEFKRRTAEFVRQMKKSGDPMVLTVNGKAELVVQDAESYQRLLQEIERAHAIEGIREGLASVRAGKTAPAGETAAKIRRKHDIPR